MVLNRRIIRQTRGSRFKFFHRVLILAVLIGDPAVGVLIGCNAAVPQTTGDDFRALQAFGVSAEVGQQAGKVVRDNRVARILLV